MIETYAIALVLFGLAWAVGSTLDHLLERANKTVYAPHTVRQRLPEYSVLEP